MIDGLYSTPRKRASLIPKQMYMIEKFNVFFVVSRIELNWRTLEEESLGSIRFFSILILEGFELVLPLTKALLMAGS